MVIRAGGGAGQSEPTEAGGGGRMYDALIDARPDRVERRQPAEQRLILRHATRRPLIEVVVCVDQARSEQATAAIYLTFIMFCLLSVNFFN